MNILITSLVDLNNCAPNRLHHLINYLSCHNEISIICPFDWWRGEQGAIKVTYNDFSELIKRVRIEHITRHRSGPILQEIFLSRLNRPYSNMKFDLIFNYNTIYFGRQASINLNLPAIYDIADDLPELAASSSRMPNLFRNLGRTITRKMVEKNIMKSKKVTAISQIYQDEYSIPDSKFELLPNGVDTNHFRPMISDVREKLRIKEDTFLLGYVGVLREWVNLEPVLRTMKLMDNLHLMIVGEEGWLDHDRELINDSSIKDRIITTGTVPYSQVPLFISAMDCCIIPFNRSKISQFSVPLKLFEYMSCGKPVISTNIAGVREIAGERINYAESIEDYAKSISQIKEKKFSQAQLQDNRDFVTKKYDWSIIGRKLETIMENLI